MKTKNYYLIENGQQIGPFTYDELKMKNMNSNSSIWYDGLDNWLRVGEIPELLHLIEKTPPPFENHDNKKSAIPPIPDALHTPDINTSQIPKYEIASVWERLGGYIILNIFTLILFFAFGGDITDLDGNGDFATDYLYAGLASGLLNGIFYPFFSGNIGHKLLNLKVINKKDGSSVKNYFFGFFRESLKGSFSVAIIPLLWILFDKDNQNSYDRVFGTLVVRNKD